MRARGKESVKVASFARSSMTVSAVSASESVCIGSPRARRPLVVWLRFAASRLGRRRGTVGLLIMFAPPSATTERQRASRARFARFGISNYPVHQLAATTLPHSITDAPNIVSKTSIRYRAQQTVVRSHLCLNSAPLGYTDGDATSKFSQLTFSRAESSLGRGDAPAKGADHQMARPSPE